MTGFTIQDCQGEKLELRYGDKGSPPAVNGCFYWDDVLKVLPHLLDNHEGKIQLVYMDPPFMTGQLFRFQQRVGDKGWRGSRDHLITHTAYDDSWKEGKAQFLEMMEEVLRGVYRLLSPEGSIYLHIDYRTSAYLRVLLDQVFGEENFLNEIIWYYQSGGRAKRHFSRKHDTLLFYRKSSQYYFNLEAAGKPRGRDKRNHMKQQVDEDGRVFWSIRSGGKEYRYYEDAKVYPSDVWDDISHLQQKDPERTGYDTQKPQALLERIIKVSSRPGDWVVDLFAGSGTTLAAAQKLGRNFLGVDKGVFSMHTCRRRLLSAAVDTGMEFHYSFSENKLNAEPPRLEILASADQSYGLRVQLLRYEVSDMELQDKGIENSSFIQQVDYWAVGLLESAIFHAKEWSFRSLEQPSLEQVLFLKGKERGVPAVHVVDIYGNQGFYKLEI